MPELAAFYTFGLIVSLAFTFLYLALRLRRSNSAPHRLLQSNLRKADLFWSEEEDRIVAWSVERERMEYQRSRRNVLVMGALLSLLSWGGFLFLLVIALSDRFFAQSRRERRLLASALAANAALERSDVEWLVHDLSQ